MIALYCSLWHELAMSARLLMVQVVFLYCTGELLGLALEVSPSLLAASSGSFFPAEAAWAVAMVTV